MGPAGRTGAQLVGRPGATLPDSEIIDCAEVDEAICGSDPPSVVAAIALLAAVGLLPWMPRPAYLLGIGSGLWGAVLDGSPVVQAGSGVLSATCVISFAALPLHQRRQRRDLSGTGSATDGSPAAGSPADRSPVPVTRRLPARVGRPGRGWRSGLAGLLLVGGFGALGWYRYLMETEAELLTDNWLAVGLVAVLLGSLWGLRELTGLRWPGRVAGRDLAARRVLVDSDGGNTYLFAVDRQPGDRPFAVLATEAVALSPGWDTGRAGPAGRDRFGRPQVTDPGQAWRGEVPVASAVEPGTVLGDLTTGSWVAVRIRDAVLLPRGPLRHPRPGSDRPTGGSSLTTVGLPGIPVSPADRIPADLPWVLRRGKRVRLAGLGLMVAMLIAAGAHRSIAGTLEGSNPILFVMSGFGIVSVFLKGWSMVGHRLVLGPGGVTLVGPLLIHKVPAQTLHGVRLDGSTLTFTWADEAFDAGPFPRAEEAGAAAGALRERALARGSTDREPTFDVRSETVLLLIALAAAFAAGWAPTWLG